MHKLLTTVKMQNEANEDDIAMYD